VSILLGGGAFNQADASDGLALAFYNAQNGHRR
jgi:hypothetical protein